MRCDQQMGLPPEAITFLELNERKPEVCPCCNRPYPKVLTPIGLFEGMFETKYQLHRHELTNGKYADEYLQAAPWHSGPCFFLGLKIVNGLDFKWSESEIAKA